MKTLKFILSVFSVAAFLSLPISGHSLLIPYSGPSVVVNVNAALDGETGAPHLTGVILPEGTYSFEIVGPSDDPRASYIAWSPFISLSRWITAAALGTPSGGMFALLGDGVDRGSPSESFDQTVNRRLEFHFDGVTTVNTWVRDNLITDNRGGVSIKVSEIAMPVPEMSTYGVVSAAMLFSFVGYRQRMSRA